ncbi:MAG TPA: condensation domain-containing protein, partial [Rugosimonospora sp.]|nr:condensation domain-containing protein [Rugosimonospora sp.]
MHARKRDGLPAPGRGALVTRAFVAPRTPVERRLAAVWGEVLGVDPVGVTDTFFDLGGDSIRAVSLVAALRAAGFDASVRDVFEANTVALLAGLVDGRAAPAANTAPVAPFTLIEEADRAKVPDGVVDAYPLSQLQLGMLVEMFADEHEHPYHNVTMYRINDERPLDPDALRAAVARVAARHEVLRTSLHLTGFSVPMQLVHGRVAMPVSIVDLCGRGADAVTEAVRAHVAREYRDLFDIGRPSLVRVSALVADDGWRMVLTLCHAIMEGYGHYRLWDEILGTYRALRDGREPEQPPLPEVRYADAIAGELAALRSEEDRAYWRGVVTGYAKVGLPAAWAQPDEPQTAYQIHLSLRDLTERLRGVASALGVSLKSVYHAAHLKVMSQLTQEERFHTGLVVDTRPEAPGAERVYGMYLNTLPFAADRSAATWRELIQQVYAQEARVWAHRRFPLPEVQREAGGRRAVDVFFNYLDFGHVDTSVLDAGETLRSGATEFPLAVTVLNGYLGLLSHSHAMSRSNAQRLGQMYRAVLEAILADLDGDARRGYLPAGERELALGGWACGPAAIAGPPVHELFEAQAARVPEAVAVREAERCVSYRELNAG